jgi:hypothetical protein
MTTKKFNTKKVVDVKKLAGNDRDQEIVVQSTSAQEQEIALAKTAVEAAKKVYDEAKANLRKLTGQKSKEPKGPGVITTILSLVTNSGKTGISKADILSKLTEMFPDHNPEGLGKTISVQLPKRLSKERNVKIEKTEKGNFILVK